MINRIGSAQDSDVRLTGGGVAPMHARLWHDGASWVVREIDPAAVTRVNGARVGFARVAHGDILTIAAWTLVLVNGRVAATRTRKPTRERHHAPRPSRTIPPSGELGDAR